MINFTYHAQFLVCAAIFLIPTYSWSTNNDPSHPSEVTSTKVWNKKELSERAQFSDIPPTTLERIKNYIKSNITRVGHLQNERDKRLYAIYDRNKEMTNADLTVLIGAQKPLTYAPFKFEEIRLSLTGDMKTVLSDDLKAQFNQWTNLANGISFDLSPSIFNKDQNQGHKKTKYGLILKSIEQPKNQKKLDLAYINQDITHDELAYATSAHPQWTIGPLKEEPAILLNFSEAETPTDSVWLPELKLKTQILPNQYYIDEFRTQKKISPNYIFKQSQGYFELHKIGRNDKGLPETIHIYRIPKFNNIEIVKIYNDKNQLLESRFNNLRLLSYLPTLNLSYSHLSKQYASQIIINYPQQSFLIEAKGIEHFSRPQKMGTYKATYTLRY